jgi:hypothetical protein
MCLSESHKVFEAFICWIYTGRIKEPPPKTDKTDVYDHYYGMQTLIEIWIFADIRGVSGLGNATIDMYHERIAANSCTYCHRSVDFVYENTLKSAKLRNLVAYSITMTNNYETFMEWMADKEKPNAEFLLESTPMLMETGSGPKNLLTRSKWARVIVVNDMTTLAQAESSISSRASHRRQSPQISRLC